LTILQEYDLNGEPKGKLKLPKIFETTIRPDVIKKVVLFQQSHRYQPQGRNLMAGKRTSAKSIGTGHGIARMARVKGSRYPKAQQAAFVPSAVGGYRTHPPKTEKKIYKRINKKERRLALHSAIAATAYKNLVISRGHRIETVPMLPLVISDTIQDINTAQEAREICSKIGLLPDIQRVKRSLKIRAGRGTMRGRRRRHGVGPLFVINKDGGIKRALNNFLGVDVVIIKDLNAELLAPGTSPGRLTVWTASAFKNIDGIFL
jgi:large subunit ribosomal protein L4e